MKALRPIHLARLDQNMAADFAAFSCSPIVRVADAGIGSVRYLGGNETRGRLSKTPS